MAKPQQNSTTEAWFFETKLTPPKSTSSLMDRREALSRVEEASRYKLGLIIAPAGFGKSSILGQWYQNRIHADDIVAWLSLDYADSDVKRFASYVIIALDSAGVDMGTLRFAAEQSLIELSIHAILSRMVQALVNTSSHTFIALDDFYQAECPEIIDFVTKLLEHAPDNLHIIISSRSQPDLQIGSRVVNGSACVVDKQSLCFSLQEIRDYLGDGFSEASANTLLEQTEGWAVAIQLATVANKGETEIVSLFSGKQQYIVNYFTEQILDRSTELEKRFLLLTSVLDKFNGSLAKAVTGIENVSQLIYESKNIQSLIVTLDKEETWFRYHHLFSELLLTRLKRDDEDAIPELYNKASHWFEQANNLNEAIKHARLSGDVDRAAELFLGAGGWELVLYGGVSLMRTLLRNFSSKDLERHPEVHMAYIYFILKDGNIQEADARFSKSRPSKQELQQHPELKRTYYLVSYFLRIYKDDFTDPFEFCSLEELIDSWDKNDFLGIAVLRAERTLSAITQGDFTQAHIAAKEGLRDMRKAGSILGENYLYIHLGQIELHKACLDLAQEYLSEAANMAKENFGIDSRLKTNCDINLQSLSFWCSPEQFDAEQMLGLLTNACDTDGWFEIYAAGFISLVEHVRLFQKTELAEDLIDLLTSAAKKRQIVRLEQLSMPFGLTMALSSNDKAKALQIIDNIQSDLLVEDKDKAPINWLPLCETTFALGVASLKGYEISEIMPKIDKCITLSQSFNANMYLIRLLVLKATLFFKCDRIEPAIATLLQAAKLATAQSIKTPFFVFPTSLALMEKTVKQYADSTDNFMEINFLKKCILQCAHLDFMRSAMSSEDWLSKREMDVIHELAKGMSNKEIARNLEMTNNTVKFHLKNIFLKFDVDKRISAVNRARSLGLI
ncbi:LuxR C-terminal-related transcriptional regulator [Paraglaciecola marina]|uniref:LuxR C-terminal-related transcriptional regulator n=1 Tax=Paraglaciecola marina TaxID=2500157 RepID=UPI0010620D6B|nr:LuxR C-terminal-related transcriptional regulator [Paraglaciecola marina]